MPSLFAPLDPDKIEYAQLPGGGAAVRLANGARRLYSEEELAEMTVTLLQQCDSAPETVDEAWLEIVQRLVGRERWSHAVEIVAALS